ncbi:hypothetical protein MNBD_GAMMA17-1331, partial [hydrothermal vent metagenome]
QAVMNDGSANSKLDQLISFTKSL